MDNQKTQVLERLKQATNILVAVSSSPSVDQLSAAIGLTLMLNHMGKHATAVFSGEVPSTIEFLQPEQTLEKTTDSLRDFIIALDKSKADKLRYKVEDQMVKIFITPYRTSISDKDLEFSQGDFNVEVVMALGVNEQTDLDQAITSHGRILHDATVMSLGTRGSQLGSINWNDNVASSLCEMVVSLGLSLKADVLDAQSATALLTGIVAETERFSNEKTSSETMQISAKLMTAGANQQLVASQLQKPKEPSSVAEAMDDKATAEQVQADLSSEALAKGEEPSAELPEVVEETVIDDLQPQSTPEPVIEQPTTDLSIKLATTSQPDRPTDAMVNQEQPATNEPVAGDLADEESSTTKSETKADAPGSDGSLLIDHGEAKPLLDLDNPEEDEPQFEQIHIDEEGVLKTEAEVALANQKIIQSEPLTDTKPLAGDTRLILEPPQLGGKLTANSEPEQLDPSTDPLGVSSKTEPLLSHQSNISSTTSEPVTEFGDTQIDTLTDLEKAEESPHVEQSHGDVSSARDAVSSAVAGTTQSILEPVQALNAQPMDLNLEDPLVATPPIIDSVSSDTVFPSVLVKSDPGLPTDNTAASVTDATAPPPVPPPMMPPVIKPIEAPNPSDSAL